MLLREPKSVWKGDCHEGHVEENSYHSPAVGRAAIDRASGFCP